MTGLPTAAAAAAAHRSDNSNCRLWLNMGIGLANLQTLAAVLLLLCLSFPFIKFVLLICCPCVAVRVVVQFMLPNPSALAPPSVILFGRLPSMIYISTPGGQWLGIVITSVPLQSAPDNGHRSIVLLMTTVIWLWIQFLYFTAFDVLL